MDGISVKDDIVQVEANTTHVLVAEDTLLGSPLEAGHAGILDLVKVLQEQTGFRW